VIEKHAKLEVRAPCKVCVGTLEFRTASFARPRTLTIAAENGRVIAYERVDAEPRSIRVPVRFSRRTIVTLTVNPPPDRIDKFIGGTDMRTVAVSVIQPVTFVPEASRGR
jgi:hypothetical protein